MDLMTCTKDIWACLQDESSREALSLIGAFVVAIIVGIWAIFKNKSGNQQSSGGGLSSPNTNNGPIIGYSIEQHQQILAEREAQIRVDLERAHSAEKAMLERQLQEINSELNNPTKSYQEKIAQLEEQITHLNQYQGLVPLNILDEAKQALIQGDTGKADELYAVVEEKGSELVADAVYQRGQIARQNLEWQAALIYFEKASQLMPNNAQYENQLALSYESNGLYDKAQPLYEKLLQNSQKNSTEFATNANNLAELYKTQGKYAEAEPLYRQAIGIAEKVLGQEHPNTQIIKENYEGFLEEKK